MVSLSIILLIRVSLDIASMFNEFLWIFVGFSYMLIIDGFGNILNDFHMNYQWVWHLLYDLSNQA
jgi:hypothetical protein